MSESRCDMAPLFSIKLCDNFIITLRYCPYQAAVLTVLWRGVCFDPRPVHEDERLPEPLLGLGGWGRWHCRQVRTRHPLNPLKTLFHPLTSLYFHPQLVFSHACCVAPSILLFFFFASDHWLCVALSHPSCQCGTAAASLHVGSWVCCSGLAGISVQIFLAHLTSSVPTLLHFLASIFSAICHCVWHRRIGMENTSMLLPFHLLCCVLWVCNLKYHLVDVNKAEWLFLLI